MGITTAIVSAVGTVVSAAGAISAGEQQQTAANYNAEVARVDAINAQNTANAQAGQVEQDTKRKLGLAAAAYGAAGVDMSGSPLSVMSDLASQGELSKRLTLYRGQTQAQSLQQQASLDTFTGQTAASAGLAKAGGTLLTGLTSAARDLKPQFDTPTTPGTELIRGGGGGP